MVEERVVQQRLVGFFCEMYSVMPEWEKDDDLCEKWRRMRTRRVKK